jgi:REP element-mobilizing transposase RayT
MTADDVGSMRLKRLKWVYKDSPVYFLTLNAHNRKHLLANREMHQAFRNFCERAAEYGVSVGRYVLMPDHIHLFAAFGPGALELSRWVKSLKNSLSKCLRGLGVPAPHWQKDFFDHLLRAAESYSEKWEYVKLKGPDWLRVLMNGTFKGKSPAWISKIRHCRRS